MYSTETESKLVEMPCLRCTAQIQSPSVDTSRCRWATSGGLLRSAQAGGLSHERRSGNRHTTLAWHQRQHMLGCHSNALPAAAAHCLSAGLLVLVVGVPHAGRQRLSHRRLTLSLIHISEPTRPY